MEKKLMHILKFLLIATLFVPLLVFPSSYIFPFIVPKIIWFRSLVVLALAFYFGLLAINFEEYRPKINSLNIVILLFILSFTISTFTGVDPYHSFWDNHERMLGLFTLVHYVVFYFIITSVFKTWKDWQWTLRFFLAAGSLVMLIGILQKINPDLLMNNGNPRVSSTLGNAIYLGGYGVFMAFAGLFNYIKEKHQLWKYFSLAAVVLGLAGMSASGTRGSVLGLLVGVVITIVVYAVLAGENRRVKYGLWGFLGLILLIIFFLYSFRSTQFIKEMPAVGRAVNTTWSDIKDSPRWIAWEIAVEAWKERPLFGWGPNNYFYAFNKYYNPRSLEFGYGETWFDNAHNIILNTLAVQGFFGLLFYLLLYSASFHLLFKGYRQNNIDKHILALGYGFLVAHFIGNVTVFENPTSYLYFMYWLAMVNGLSSCKEEKTVSGTRQVGYGTMSLLIAFSLIIIFVTNVQPARANKMTLEAIRALNQNPTKSLEQIKLVLGFNSPHIDDIRSDIARALTAIIGTENNQLSQAIRPELFITVYGELQKNVELHPLDIRNQMNLAQLAEIGYQLTGDSEFMSQQKSYLLDAYSKSPRRQQLVYMLAGLEAQAGNFNLAQTMLESAVEDNPRIGESYWRLAYTYKLNNNVKDAEEIIKEARKRGITFTPREETIIQNLLNN